MLLEFALSNDDSCRKRRRRETEQTPEAEIRRFAVSRHLMKIKRVLTCPISQCILYDPVTHVESGHTFDRTQLCKWPLINPTRCPATGVDFGEKLKYRDNVTVRKILAMYMGDEAYQKYNDSRFRNKYEALDAGRLVEPDATTLLVQKSRPTLP